MGDSNSDCPEKIDEKIDEKRYSGKRLVLWVVLGLLVNLVIAGACYCAFARGCISDMSLNVLAGAAPRSAEVSGKALSPCVTALGRLEPFGEVVKLGMPGFLHDERIDAVLVHEGQSVKAGQIVCTVDITKRLKAKRLIALNNLSKARARLAQVKAGEKQGQIDAQKFRVDSLVAERNESLTARKALLASLTAQCAFAEREQQRYETLYLSGAVSASQLDEKRAQYALARGRLLESQADLKRVAETLEAQTSSARADLARVKEVRPVDVELAAQDVLVAEADLRAVDTDIDLSLIRAPRSGHVLKVNIRPGEVPGERGLMDIGATERMVAVAEVYQTDIGKVRKGQSATISGDALPHPVKGVVYSLGWKVTPQKTLSDSPDTPNDRRVVEVKILLDSEGAKTASQLTDMEVDVRINTAS